MAETVLITGASSGIGKATARYFAEKGWNVAATMRKPQKVTDLQETQELKKIALDVQDKSSIQSAVQETLTTFGNIDVVVNNAGYGLWGPMEEIKDDKIRRQFDVNVFGLIDVIKEALPTMRAQKSGIIINVSSVGGKLGTPLGSMYHGTKFAVEGITETLNYELNPVGIKARLVEPGGVRTDFAGRSLDVVEHQNPDYERITTNLMKAFDNPDLVMGTAEGCAKVIYKAATNPGKKMRYVYGNDAKFMIMVKDWFGTNAVQGLMKRMLKL
ncbi:MAG: SDR family oxidoreductase [Bacteroidota bacterium]